jgi:predicted negative regulator of RcsB-dependent stress response
MWNKIKNFLKENVITIICIVVIIVCQLITGSRYYWLGYNNGYSKALDTFNVIVKNQASSDTSHCTELDFVKKDTTRYYLMHNPCKSRIIKK